MAGAARARYDRKRLKGARRLRRRRYNYPSLQAEPKFYDTSRALIAVANGTDFSGSEVNPSAGVSLISTPAVGDSESSRDGKKIVITQVEVKGRIQKSALDAQTALPEGIFVWVALVLDTQTNGVEMNSEDCFKAITNVASEIQPFRNLLYGGRFRVLKLKKIYINSLSTGTVSATTYDIMGKYIPFKMFKKLRLPVNFNAGTTSSVANVIDNSLHMHAWCSVSNAVNVAYQARIRFIG